MEQVEQLKKIGASVTDDWLNQQLALVVERVRNNMAIYGDKFPSAAAVDGRYRLKENDDWTNGFWTAMLWMAYELSGDTTFKNQAERNVTSFQQRLENDVVLNHHDIGFLYSLSLGGAVNLYNSPNEVRTLVAAAEKLVSRYQQHGDFIQAWGNLGDPDEYRLIIDSLLNLPLLIKAGHLTGQTRFLKIAWEHYQTLLQTVIKPDGSTYHTYYFDSKTGVPLKGVTRQGARNNSVWARGQAWAVLGLPLETRLFGLDAVPDVYPKVVDYFMSHFPKDLVPYWDFDYNDDAPSYKDSSSAAIVAAGMLEAQKLGAYPDAGLIAKGLIYQLGEHYTAFGDKDNEGILQHGVYAYKDSKGIDEPNLWGDYFYFEALMRIQNQDWTGYW